MTNRLFRELQKTLWFSIGSIDSLERNVENAQLDLGLDKKNHIPIVYRSEAELSHVSNILPTVLLIGFTWFLMRKATGAMGKRSGLFGGVMSSTAKVVNPSEINVRFK